MHKISSVDKNFQIGSEVGFWNKKVMQRRRALAHSDTESTSDAKESPSPPPPPESLIPKLPSGVQPSKKISNCSCRKSCASVKKQNNSCTLIQEKLGQKPKDMAVQQLEAKLYNAELEEAMHSERLERAHRRLHRVAQLVDAQVMFIEAMHLKARTVERLAQLAGSFAYKDLTPTESLSQALDNLTWDDGVLEKLTEVQGVMSAYNEAPEQVDQLLEDFREKRKDYKMAASTFSQYLRSTSRMSSSQLRKYEAQYDSIKAAYESSRQALEAEFPKLVQERLEVLEHCFSKLLPVINELLKQDTQFLAVWKELMKNMQDPAKKQSCRHGCGDRYQPQNTKMPR